MRILYLLAGVSYYKTTAAPPIDLGYLDHHGGGARLPAGYYVDGLGEFAYRNGLDLRGLEVVGPDARRRARRPLRRHPGSTPDPLRRRHRLHRDGRGARAPVTRMPPCASSIRRASASPPLRMRPA